MVTSLGHRISSHANLRENVACFFATLDFIPSFHVHFEGFLSSVVASLDSMPYFDSERIFLFPTHSLRGLRGKSRSSNRSVPHGRIHSKRDEVALRVTIPAIPGALEAVCMGFVWGNQIACSQRA